MTCSAAQYKHAKNQQQTRHNVEAFSSLITKLYSSYGVFVLRKTFIGMGTIRRKLVNRAYDHGV